MDLNFYPRMCDYIERQWLALCGGWGSLLCRDLRLLLLTWLNQDADVLYARSCIPHSLCSACQWCPYNSECWGQHLRQPGRHMLLVQCNAYNLRSEYQTEELCLAAVQQNGWALEFVCNQTKDAALTALNAF